jgi:hypothetical protein
MDAQLCRGCTLPIAETTVLRCTDCDGRFHARCCDPALERVDRTFTMAEIWSQCVRCRDGDPVER